MPPFHDFTAQTILPPDDLRFARLDGFDAVSRCFRYDVDLVSLKHDLAADDHLGQGLGVKISLPDKKRFFHGYVAEFGLKGFHEDLAIYRLVLRPWLWFASLRRDNRIFQQKSVVDIAEEVLGFHKHCKIEKRLQKTYKPRDYCVQYGESDLDFVQRLLEHEGIFYHFDHEEGSHTLVLTDAMAKVKPSTLTPDIIYNATILPGQRAYDVITDWHAVTGVRQGVNVHTDYNFEKPAFDLMAKSDQPFSHLLAAGETYHYPGNYMESAPGEALALIRREEEQAPHRRAEAKGPLAGLWSGVTFKFDKFPREAENAEYLVLRSDYQVWDSQYRAGEGASTGFQMVVALAPTDLPYRPERQTPKPVMKGPQTAVVVGPAGAEIFTDKYSRVKVQFHWDRLGKKDQDAGCFIRVSAAWAGAGWGFIQIPRIGQEVIVDFLEGDPDQPIITGRVYNAAQMPPYGLPGSATQSGWKSNSSPGGGGWNELRFEDKAGSEEVYFQAQKDHNELVKNNESRKIGNDFAENVGHDAKQDIGHDRSETVGHDKKVSVTNNRNVSIGVNDDEKVGSNRSLAVGANETITVGGNSSETISKSHTQTVALMQTISVGINMAVTVGAAQETTVGAARAVTVGGGQTHTIGASDSHTVGAGQTLSVGADQSVTIGGGQTESVAKDVALKIAGGRATEVTKADMLAVKADMGTKVDKKYVLDVGDEITIKCGDAQISMKKDGTITIKGKDITLDGSGKINAKAGGDITMKGSKINQN